MSKSKHKNKHTRINPLKLNHILMYRCSIQKVALYMFYKWESQIQPPFLNLYCFALKLILINCSQVLVYKENFTSH